MAFVNEKLTQEQIDDFEKRNIVYFEHEPLNPVWQTIDRTRNMCLINYDVTSKDDPEEEIYFIERNQKKYFIKLCCYSKSIAPRRAEITWNGFEILPGSDTPSDVEDFKEDIKAALKVYGLTGSSNPRHQIDVDTSVYHFDF
jgi:hypothetical protein